MKAASFGFVDKNFHRMRGVVVADHAHCLDFGNATNRNNRNNINHSNRRINQINKIYNTGYIDT